MLTALMLNFNCSVTQEQENELEKLWNELHHSPTPKDTIDALITFNKIRMITDSANKQSPNNRQFNVSYTNDRRNVEFKIGGFVILKKPVTDFEASFIKNSTTPYGQIKNDLTTESLQQALSAYVRKPLVDIINELNAPAVYP